MRLINADLAVKAFERLKHDKEYSDIEDRYECGIDACIDEIREIEPIDAKPVVHAHWTEDSYGYSSCSGCGFTFNWPDYKTEFCPCCGAKMDYTI